MSHELRTPLSAVIGYTELLEEEAEEAHETAMLGRSREDQVEREAPAEADHEVLDLSKVEANKMEIFRNASKSPRSSKTSRRRWTHWCCRSRMY